MRNHNKFFLVIVETPLVTNNILAETLSGEEGTWTIQVIYPGEEVSDSGFLTRDDEVLVSVDNALEVEEGGQLKENHEEQVTISTIPKESQGDKYVCPKCDKVYNARRNLVRHINLECGKEPKYICMYCDYKNHRRNEINKHIKKKHDVFME